MANSKFSHSFLVGNFNGDVRQETLEKNGWQLQVLGKNDYEERLTMYYKSHVDSMLEADGQEKPEFLQTIHHYRVSFQEVASGENVVGKTVKAGQPVSIRLSRGGEESDFVFQLVSLHLYLFPLDIALVAIEIDDSGTDLDQMRLAHKLLINWEENINQIADERFLRLLSPLSNLIPGNDLSTLVEDGNNLKIFQIVQTEDEAPNDKLLFEIATFSPIGSACGNKPNSLSEAYFKQLMAENAVSTYYNWKALSLVDSFTVLAGNGFHPWQWVNLYFPLIYLRCIFEKTYCFARNNTYRLGLQETANQLSEEIADMEKHYFYNTISYNFQPNLLYQSMAKGLDIKAEREELARQIKERAKKVAKDRKEREERWRDGITIGLSVFAIFSILWDLCSLLMQAYPEACPQIIAFNTLRIAIALLVFLLFVFFMIKRKKRQ